LNFIGKGGKEEEEKEKDVEGREKPGAISNLKKGPLFRPEEKHGDESIHQRDHEGDLKGVKVLN
jgi:hypothetical protein